MDESPLRRALRERLTQAMRDRDRAAAGALRSALAALSNAEAVPTDGGLGPTTSAHVAGAAIGLGAGEADRLELGAAAELDLVRGEIRELRHSIEIYEAAGDPARAAVAERGAAVLESALAAVSS